jgi:hypothetical protein
MDPIVDWLLAHYPGLIFGALALAIVIWASVWCTNKYWIAKNLFLNSTQKLSNLDKRMLQVDNRLVSLDGSLASIEKNMTNLTHSLSNISLFLTTKFKLTNDLFASKSPTQLTPIGEMLLEQSGGKKFVDEYQLSLIASLEALKPQTGLDVQTACEALILEKSNEDIFNRIKQYIFNNPVYRYTKDGEQREIGVDLNVISTVMGIYLRNKYFEKYPALAADL